MALKAQIAWKKLGPEGGTTGNVLQKAHVTEFLKRVETIVEDDEDTDTKKGYAESAKTKDELILASLENLTERISEMSIQPTPSRQQNNSARATNRVQGNHALRQPSAACDVETPALDSQASLQIVVICRLHSLYRNSLSPNWAMISTRWARSLFVKNLLVKSLRLQ
jgi:hypothetical protein